MKRGPQPMLPDATQPVPALPASLLAVFGPLSTAPSFPAFCGLACEFLSQAGKRTLRDAGRRGLVPDLAGKAPAAVP